MCVWTIPQNLEGFFKGQIQCAIKAGKLQATMGSPAKANFEGMVHGKLTDDCCIDIVSICNAHTIFGPDLTGLTDWTVMDGLSK